jgi:protein TonB
MLASALIPVPAGWATARASRPDDARRTLLRNALLLSSALHLAAGLFLSHLLRERPGEIDLTLAMRPRVVLLPPGATDLTQLRIARPAPAGAPAKAGVPVPVRDEMISRLDRALADWLPVPGPVPGPASGGPAGVGAEATRALPPPPASTALPIGAAVDEPPRVIQRVEPTYPSFALEAGLEGRVVLHALVGTDGTVREIRVAEGSKIFIEAATQAVRRWLFQPARVGARPVPIWVEIPVRFRL